MRFLLGLLCLGTVAMGVADTPHPVRIPIRHADPWAIRAMLEGQQLRSPEISTLGGVAGAVGTAAKVGVNMFLQSGHLIVNPTDNSLWFYPDRQTSTP